MFSSHITPPAEMIGPVLDQLRKLEEHITNKCLRPSVAAAVQPIKDTFRSLAATHRSKDDPPLRKLRGTNVYVVRPHFADSFRTKVWKKPDGNGYIGFAGPMSIEVPHNRWFERGTGVRMTKTGANRGSMPAYHLLSRTVQQSESQAINVFTSTLTSKLNEFQGS